MARTKYSERFCTYCNKVTRMEIAGEMNGVEGKIWHRCTRCHHTSLIVTGLDGNGQSNGKLDRSTATPYNPGLSFKVGEAIFHTEWDDVGKVLSKAKTSDGSESILVSFEKAGQRRLIENLKPEPAELPNAD